MLWHVADFRASSGDLPAENSESPPGRALRPVAYGVSSPFRRLVGVAGCAGIGNFVFRCGRRRNEFKVVRADESVRRTFGRDLRHVAGDAGAASAAFFVMRVFRKRSGARAVR